MIPSIDVESHVREALESYEVEQDLLVPEDTREPLVRLVTIYLMCIVMMLRAELGHGVEGMRAAWDAAKNLVPLDAAIFSHGTVHEIARRACRSMGTSRPS